MIRMIEILPIPVLRDNYVWMLHRTDSSHVVLVDPGEAAPVLTAIQQRAWQLQAILVTHHHLDHIGGVEDILRHHPVPVYGPASEHIGCVSEGLDEMKNTRLAGVDFDLTVLAVPGHTRGALAYYMRETIADSGASGLVCSGDTLFAAGCGRIFEGTAEQMFASLQRFTDLPEDTLLCCGHEYTCANLHFAAAVEPGNSAVLQRLTRATAQRAADLPTVPAALRLESESNPFLRCHEASVQASVAAHAEQRPTNVVETFAALRAWKDNFTGAR